MIFDPFDIGFRGQPYPDAQIEAMRGTSPDWHQRALDAARLWDLGRRWRKSGVDPRKPQPTPARGASVTVIVNSPWCLDLVLDAAKRRHPGVPIAIAPAGEAPQMGFVPA